MKSRIAGTLLPVALAAATVTALGAPASAEEASPPRIQDAYGGGDCVSALNILSNLKLLPEQPDLGRALCLLGLPKQQPTYQYEVYQNEVYQNEAYQTQAYQESYNDSISELINAYITDTGQSVQETKLLGLPIVWPESLTVHVPTHNGSWHSYYSAPRH